jgi:hypothetical protein
MGVETTKRPSDLGSLAAFSWGQLLYLLSATPISATRKDPRAVYDRPEVLCRCTGDFKLTWLDRMSWFDWKDELSA